MNTPPVLKSRLGFWHGFVVGGLAFAALFLLLPKHGTSSLPETAAPSTHPTATARATPPQTTATVTEPPPPPPPAPARPTPKELAIKNSVAYLDSILGRGSFTVLSSDAVFNDPERNNGAYAITVLLEVRFPGPSPTGYVKRSAMFACAYDGSFIAPLSLPTL